MAGHDLMGVPHGGRWIQFVMLPTADITPCSKSPTPRFDKAFYRRVGDSMEVVWNYLHVSTDTPGTPGSGRVIYPIPGGNSVNKEVMPYDQVITDQNKSAGAFSVGVGCLMDNVHNGTPCIVSIDSTGRNLVINFASDNAPPVKLTPQNGGSTYSFDNAVLGISLKAMIPIQGWDNI